MVTWAQTCTALAADLMAGDEDPRGHVADLLGRALAALPAPARAARIRLRADAGYFAGQLARAAMMAGVEFAIGAKRIAPLWRILDGVAEGDWVDAIGTLVGHGVRKGQAMITTLRHKLIRVPARLVRHAGALTLRLPPGYPLLEAVLARLRALPTPP